MPEMNNLEARTPWLSFRDVIPHVTHAQKLGDCIDRDKIETSTKYFQDLVTIKARIQR